MSHPLMFYVFSSEVTLAAVLDEASTSGASMYVLSPLE